MPAGSQNKTDLASVVSAVNTLKTNSSQATGDAKVELALAAKRLSREVDRYKALIQGLN